MDNNLNISIEGREVGPEKPCFIIAEVGVNHNGDPELAHKMIDAIADAGADCVKFQTFHAEEFVNNPDDTYEYVSQGEKVSESMLEMFKRLEFGYDEFESLFEHVRRRGLIPMSTPTDKRAVDLLEKLGSNAFKIGSDDLVYTPFLEYVAGKGLPMIISTGMAESEDIERAVATIAGTGNKNLMILHCVSLYPTPCDALNLNKIKSLQTKFDLPIGYSDHSWGMTSALGAVALGAVILEKHFTLDRNMAGPDHAFSSDPGELAQLVKEVRYLEAGLGNGTLGRTEQETEMAELCHRSIVAARDIKANQTISLEDIGYQRPGTGLKPYRYPEIVGLQAHGSIKAGTLLSLDHITAKGSN
jgi:N,N'-diacetyllegionaminate synthase